jgi:aminoglycoside phosphotransferase family enzyme/predicted kinase
MNLEAHEQMVSELAAELPDAEVIQTHISSIILCRDVVYKLKKPVDFGFLDYSDLPKRHHCCLEELRSNRRFAAGLYLGLVTVTGTPEVPMIEGEGEVIDYAVKMRRFEESQQLDHVVDRRELRIDAMDAIAQMIASFHTEARCVAADAPYGTPERVLQPMTENFELLDELIEDEALCRKLAEMKQWTLKRFEEVGSGLEQRKAEGFIRECHGDMHLHNMAYFDSELIMFDAIEFNDFLSHIDVISDLAFLLMDLEYRGLEAYASRLLNAYLEITGDYGSSDVLNFYKVYRAMVRAKVAALRCGQNVSLPEYEIIMGEVRRYVDLAFSYTQDKRAVLAITHGFSGSGKSTAALMAVEHFGAIRLRSDVERMRLFRKTGDDEKKEEVGQGIYTPEATEATYQHLEHVARELIGNGIPVIVDATFLKTKQRKRFQHLAEDAGVEFVILHMQCSESLMRERVAKRESSGEDISEATVTVLEHQLQNHEPLQDDEFGYRHNVDCTIPDRMQTDISKAGL